MISVILWDVIIYKICIQLIVRQWVLIDEPINVKNITLDNTNLKLNQDYVYKTITIKNMVIPFVKIKAETLIINQALVSSINVDNYEIRMLAVSEEQYRKNKDYLDKLNNINIEIREKIQVGD